MLASLGDALGLKEEKRFGEHFQQTGLAAGLIEIPLPDKPKSSKQLYCLTALGKAVRAKFIRAHS